MIYRYTIYISIKYRWKYGDKKSWFRVRLVKIHQANIFEKCGEQVNITIGFSVDNVILKMGIIILAN